MRTFSIALTALCLSSSVAAADGELSFGLYGRSLRAASATALTGDGMMGTEIAGGYLLPLALHPRLEVWATGSLASGAAAGAMFQSMQTEVVGTSITFGGRARYVLHPNVAVGGRLEVGPSETAMSIEVDGVTASDHAWGIATTAAAALDLLAVAKPVFSFGLRVELGYLYASAPSLSPRAPGDDDTLRLDEMQASIGHLSVSGPSLSFSMLGRF